MLILAVGCSSHSSTGINCLGITDDGVLAYAYDGKQVSDAFVSSDGGMSWEVSQASSKEEFCEPITRLYSTDQSGRPIIYKLGEDQRIGTSLDEQITWQTDHWITALTQAEEKYYGAHFGADYLDPGNVLRGVEDPGTGNLILAATVHGVIVRQPDGSYYDFGLGHYHLLEYSPINIFLAYCDHLFFLALIILISMAAQSLLFIEFRDSFLTCYFFMALSTAYIVLVIYKSWPLWLGICLGLVSLLLILLCTRFREALPQTPRLERVKIIVGAVLSMAVFLIPYIRVARDSSLLIQDGYYWFVVAFVCIQIISGFWLMLKRPTRQEIRMSESSKYPEI